ncbi:MAG TPA: type II toxin-antitoxin system VapC family toxin [Gemmatimonadota bacterium]|nr:type II toxin-antitoxin system VapC family toxin [Gemmatimonadota bacterium]
MDTSVLLDVFGADPTFLERSRNALRKATADGGLIACEVVWAEVGRFFGTPDAAAEAMDQVGIAYDPVLRDAALTASVAWRRYRRRGGARTRVIADFLVGAHATARADRLLTRDRGFYRSYFKGLPVLDPSRG